MRTFYAISAFVAFLAALISVVVYFTGATTFNDLLAISRGEKIHTVALVPSPGQGASTSAPSGAETAPNPATIELEYWRSASAGNNISTFEEYLRKYPNGQFASIARSKIEELKNPKPVTPPAFNIQNPYIGTGSPTPTAYHSDVFQFDVTVPALWTRMSIPGDANNVRLRLMGPRYMTDQTNCIVVVKDVASIARFSQQQLNASVAQGDAVNDIRRDFLSTDSNAVFGPFEVVDVGDLKAQRAEASLISRGIRQKMREIAFFVPGRVYQVLCATPESVDADNKTELATLMNSFRITGH
jgi:hypothetical protein